MTLAAEALAFADQLENRQSKSAERCTGWAAFADCRNQILEVNVEVNLNNLSPDDPFVTK